MPEASDKREIFRQNLLDAGCGPEVVRRCMDLSRDEKRAELLRVLSRHRRTLLDTIHRDQERIDCLDYLVHRLEKEST